MAIELCQLYIAYNITTSFIEGTNIEHGYSLMVIYKMNFE